MFKKFLTVSLILCLFLTYTLTSTNSFVKADEHRFNSLGESWINLEAADPTALRILPENIRGVSINETFNISVVVENVTDLYGFDVQLKWDPSILHCVSWELHVPVEDYPDGVLHSPVIVIKNMVDESDNIPNAEPGTMAWWAVASMAPAEPFTGNGTIATLTFQVVGTGNCKIEFIRSPGTPVLVDQNGNPIPISIYDAYFTYGGAEIHDVALTYVTASPSEVNSGGSVYIEVGVSNEGTATETFDVTTYFDSSSIGTLTVTSLYPGESRVISFYWNTSGVPEGVYTIKAVADTVPGETDTQDNTYVDGTVTIVSPAPPPPVEGWTLLATDPDEGAGTNLKEVYGKVDSRILYFKVVHYRPWTTLNDIDTGILIDADQNSTTGLPDGSYPNQNTGIGADYLIIVGYEGPEMWRWNEDIGFWDIEHPIALAYLYGTENTNVFVVGVYLSDIQITNNAFDGAVADPRSDWDWMPDTGHFTYQLISPITVTIDIRPQALNLWSRGKWITIYMELPEGVKAKDVNVSTILLNGTVPANIVSRAKGATFLIVKFDRQAVIDLILRNHQSTNKFGTATLTVTGKLNDGTPFQGSTTVRVIMPMPRGIGRHIFII